MDSLNPEKIDHIYVMLKLRTSCCMFLVRCCVAWSEGLVTSKKNQTFRKRPTVWNPLKHVTVFVSKTSLMLCQLSQHMTDVSVESHTALSFTLHDGSLPTALSLCPSQRAPVCVFQNTVFSLTPGYKNVSLFSSFFFLRLSADPLVGSIATQYLTNRAEHDRIARQWTKRYAT